MLREAKELPCEHLPIQRIRKSYNMTDSQVLQHGVDCLDLPIPLSYRCCPFPALSLSVPAAMAFYFAKAFEDLAASTDSSAFLGGVRNVAYSFMILGSIILVSMTLQSMLMETAAGEMTREMKNAWFRALLRQDMAYYDIRDVPGQATLISSNGSKFRKGVGRKLSEAVQFFVACLGALAYSFYASWQVTLALAAIAPFLFLSTFYIVKITTTQVCVLGCAWIWCSFRSVPALLDWILGSKPCSQLTPCRYLW